MQKKRAKSTEDILKTPGLRWSPGSWGEQKRGYKISDLSYKTLDAELSAMNLQNLANIASFSPARPATPSVGGGSKTPVGDHRRPPTSSFGRSGEGILTLGGSARFWHFGTGRFFLTIVDDSWRPLARIAGGIARGIPGWSASRRKIAQNVRKSR